MIGIYIMLGGMVLFATVVGIWDLIGRQQRRRQGTRHVTNPKSANPYPRVSTVRLR